MSLTISQVVSRLRKHRPENEEGVLRTCAIPLEYLDEGAFRVTYTVVGLPLILKIPLTNATGCGKSIGSIEHSKIEIKQYKRIMRSKKRFVPIQKYMPKFYYMNEGTGLVLVHKYRLLGLSKKCEEKRQELDKIISNFVNAMDPDVSNSGNVALDNKGNLKIIDLGCFED